MKNAMQIGSIGYYGNSLDPILQQKVKEANTLVDEYNNFIVPIEDAAEQYRAIANWNVRLKKVWQ